MVGPQVDCLVNVVTELSHVHSLGLAVLLHYQSPSSFEFELGLCILEVASWVMQLAGSGGWCTASHYIIC